MHVVAGTSQNQCFLSTVRGLMNYISKRDTAPWQPPAQFHGHGAAPPTLSRISREESQVVT